MRPSESKKVKGFGPLYSMAFRDCFASFVLIKDLNLLKATQLH